MEHNFVVNNPYLAENKKILPYLFGDYSGKIDPAIVYIDARLDMYDVLVQAGIFRSRSDAKKNYPTKKIPQGFSDFIIGKLNHRISVFNPKEIQDADV